MKTVLKPWLENVLTYITIFLAIFIVCISDITSVKGWFMFFIMLGIFALNLAILKKYGRKFKKYMEED